MGPAIPGRTGAIRRDIIPVASRDRDRPHALKLELAGRFLKLRNDILEYRLIEPNEIDLVHRQYHMANAKQRNDSCVSERLGQKSLARVDQEDGEIGI